MYNDPVWLALQQNESVALNGVIWNGMALVPIGGVGMLGLFFWNGLALLSGVLALIFIGFMVKSAARMKRISSEREHREKTMQFNSVALSNSEEYGDRGRENKAAISTYRHYRRY